MTDCGLIVKLRAESDAFLHESELGEWGPLANFKRGTEIRAHVHLCKPEQCTLKLTLKVRGMAPATSKGEYTAKSLILYQAYGPKLLLVFTPYERTERDSFFAMSNMTTSTSTLTWMAFPLLLSCAASYVLCPACMQKGGYVVQRRIKPADLAVGGEYPGTVKRFKDDVDEEGWSRTVGAFVDFGCQVCGDAFCKPWLPSLERWCLSRDLL